MSATFLCFLLAVVSFVSLLCGYLFARTLVVSHCDQYGGFEYKGRYYRVIRRFRIDGKCDGLPDVLRDDQMHSCSNSDYTPPFAAGTLPKIKAMGFDDDWQALESQKMGFNARHRDDSAVQDKVPDIALPYPLDTLNDLDNPTK